MMRLKISEILEEPWVKIFFAFVVAILVVAMELAYGPPIHTFGPPPYGLGPGWECSAIKGARLCSKDVPKEFQNPKRN